MGWIKEMGRRASGPVNGLEGFGINHRSATCHSSGGGTLISASQSLSMGRYLSAAIHQSLEGATPGGKALFVARQTGEGRMELRPADLKRWARAFRRYGLMSVIQILIIVGDSPSRGGDVQWHTVWGL